LHRAEQVQIDSPLVASILSIPPLQAGGRDWIEGAYQLDPAPKEQPPRNLSGKRTAGRWHSGKQRHQSFAAHRRGKALQFWHLAARVAVTGIGAEFSQVP